MRINKELRALIRSITDKQPSLVKLVRFLYFHVWNMKIGLRSYMLGIDVNKTHWINPQGIKYQSLRVFEPMNDRGKIVGGDWDLLNTKFKHNPWYLGFKERIVDGKDWKTTDFYDDVLNKIKKEGEFWGQKSKDDWDSRIKRVESLFKDIKKNGYQSSKEIYLGKNIIKVEDEVTINIGREGDLLFNDGVHRLCIAALLKIPKIPVKIVVRHPKWVN